MKAIIIHGTMGSPEGNWFRWLSSKLEALGIETVIPAMPTPDNQSLSSWNDAFDKQCGKIESDTLLIGHSLGAVFVMRLLETLEFQIPLAVLVSPFHGELNLPEFDYLNSTFLSFRFDWEKIRVNSKKILYLIGENDPYVPESQLLGTAEALKVEPITVKDGKHLNAEAGFTSFPLLLYFIDRYLRADKFDLAQSPAAE